MKKVPRKFLGCGLEATPTTDLDPTLVTPPNPHMAPNPSLTFKPPARLKVEIRNTRWQVLDVA